MRMVPLFVLCLSVTACMSAAQKRAIGTWQDTGGGAVYTWEKVGSAVQMTTVIDSDGERFVVVSSSVRKDGSAEWVYTVPSTSYKVSNSAESVGKDQIDYAWSNEGPDGSRDSGTDVMYRTE